MPRSIRKPSYLLHKPTGQARVRIDGRDLYLGTYGSPESRDRYDELVAEWLFRQGDIDRVSLTVDLLALRFLDFADGHYRHADGTPTGAVKALRDSLGYLVRAHGTTHMRDFGPLKLKEVRQAMIDANLCRTHINRSINNIRRVFAWGVENELVPSRSIRP